MIWRMNHRWLAGTFGLSFMACFATLMMGICRNSLDLVLIGFIAMLGVIALIGGIRLIQRIDSPDDP